MSETKICARCGEEKSVKEFSKKYSYSDKTQAWCKTCVAEALRVGKSKPKDKTKTRNRTEGYP